ncbi:MULTISPECIES: NAD(P)-dependent oxidoreductase [Burkholderia]|uniref:NAD(P)-dependent oxidoreductase n=1 Tax=Burkholderia TaxID=32008 RepID=UPI000419E963|nr:MULTISPECIES: NAD(P)H-binding protein [Burkholderia]
MTQRSLNIALFGATGMIGSRIAAEAVRRGHRVTALSRRPGASGDGITAKAADLFDAASIAAALPGHDVVASAYGPKQEDAAQVVAVAKALVAGTRQAGLKRLVVVGGAGSLEVAPGKQLVDTEGFPDAYKAVALAHRDALDYLKTVADLDWTFFAPAALIAPGERTGAFRTGVGKLIADAQGNSKISAEDYAAAFVDAVEQDSFVREIATVAY